MLQNPSQLSWLDLNNIKTQAFRLLGYFELVVRVWATLFFYWPTAIIFEKDGLKREIYDRIFQARKIE